MTISRRITTCLLLLSPMATTTAFITPQTKQFTLRNTLSTTTTTSSKSPFTRSSSQTHGPLKTTQLALSPPSLPTLDSQLSADLTLYFLQTLISYGIPAVVTIIVIAFAAKSFSRRRNDFVGGSNVVSELYGDLYPSSGSSPPSNPFSNFMKRPSKITNVGVPPQEYIRVEKLNDKLDAYEYSLASALTSRSVAASDARKRNFENAFRKLGVDGSSWEPGERGELLRVEKAFLKEGGEILSEMERVQKGLVQGVIDKEMENMGVKIGEFDVEVMGEVIEVNGTESKKTPEWKKMMPEMMRGEGGAYKKKMKTMGELNTDLLKLELDFVRDVMEVLGPERANGMRATLLGNIEGGNGISAGSLLRSLRDRPLSVLFGASDESIMKKNVFVADFPGDPSASQVSELREEVTAIVRAAKEGDEALVVLQTGGGTVTGYGLAAAQLQRLKNKGMKLTICVEQVAASGGYMMCCVADRIVASPFAVLGSIGVITDIPNVYDRLKNEGIEFQTVTAGKYKRTLTPTKKPSKEDFEKTKADIEQVLQLFKSFVKTNRPILDIDSVATGETWFGEDALERKLCDEIKTKDDVLLEYVDQGFDVYNVRYEEPKEFPVSGLGFAKAREGGSTGGGLVRWLVKSLVKEVGLALGDELQGVYQGKDASKRITEKYMAKDTSEASSRVRAEDLF
mmetsp:Transcript_47547/g.57573  ORF Transcript_47547/g.57573 Transcript_47547/m.57573 type:complete len:681 (+) Transcript_47547:221-2263(+)